MMPLPLRPSNQKMAGGALLGFTGSVGRCLNQIRCKHRATVARFTNGRMRLNLFLKLALFGMCIGALPYDYALAQGKPKDAEDYEREELGVNSFTAPSVADIFHQLDDLKPLPFDQLKRELPQTSHSNREQIGLVFGGLIADGFLIVECQKQNLVEDLGRVLLRQARSLGVGDRVMRHSASLTDHGKRGDWAAVRRELIATQR